MWILLLSKIIVEKKLDLQTQKWTFAYYNIDRHKFKCISNTHS